MSAQQARTIEEQQRTIREQYRYIRELEAELERTKRPCGNGEGRINCGSSVSSGNAEASAIQKH